MINNFFDDLAKDLYKFSTYNTQEYHLEKVGNKYKASLAFAGHGKEDIKLKFKKDTRILEVYCNNKKEFEFRISRKLDAENLEATMVNGMLELIFSLNESSDKGVVDISIS